VGGGFYSTVRFWLEVLHRGPLHLCVEQLHSHKIDTSHFRFPVQLTYKYQHLPRRENDIR